MKEHKINFFKIIRHSKISGKNTVFLLGVTIFLACSNFLVSFMLQQGIDSALNNDKNRFAISAIIFILVSIFCGIGVSLNIAMKEKITLSTSNYLKKRVLKNILNTNPLEVSSDTRGELFNKIQIDCNNCGSYLSEVIFPLINLVISVIIGIIYTAYYSMSMLTIAALSVPVFISINAYFSKAISSKFSDVRVIDTDERNFLTVFFQNLILVKLFVNNAFVNSLFHDLRNKSEQRNTSLAKQRGIMKSVIENGILVVELLILLAGIPQVQSGAITLGILIGVWNASVGTFIYPIIDFPDILSRSSEIGVSVNNLWDILNFDDHRDNKVIDNKSAPEKIIVENLYFKYPKTEKYLLKNINLDLKKGEIVYIIGESGSGKSTLINLILGILKPQKGIVCGENLQQESLKDFNISAFSYVPQGNSLLNLSIRDNLLMGKEIHRNIVEKVTKECEIHNFIMSLPERYETVINSDIKISEGQAQRIAIARALLHKKPYIIMDEPFSSLDEENQKKIMKCMKNYTSDSCIIIVSHKETSLAIANKIIEIIGGEGNVRQHTVSPI